MANISKQLEEALSTLMDEGVRIHDRFIKARKVSKHDVVAPIEAIAVAYQAWYTQALPVVRQLIPERYPEFQELYKPDKRKVVDNSTYGIHDYLAGIRVIDFLLEPNPHDIFSTKFQMQLAIFQSTRTRIASLLSDIQGVLQAELFDDELSAAEELFKKGHLRAAGTLAGVTLERHLQTVLTNHGFKLAKKDPTIAELNNELKKQGIYDVPDWRFIERLGDIRNYCAHSKDREPTKDEVHEMIEGVKKVVKTIF